MNTNPYQAYKKNSVFTATPQELTLMLYEGAIKFSNKAIDELEKNNLQDAHNHMIRVQDIIVELKVTLDKKYDIAIEVEKIYEFIIQLLVEANMNKDKNKLEDALGLIREFRDLWKEVMRINKGILV